MLTSPFLILRSKFPAVTAPSRSPPPCVPGLPRAALYKAPALLLRPPLLPLRLAPPGRQICSPEFSPSAAVFLGFRPPRFVPAAEYWSPFFPTPLRTSLTRCSYFFPQQHDEHELAGVKPPRPPREHKGAAERDHLPGLRAHHRAARVEPHPRPPPAHPRDHPVVKSVLA